MNSFLPSQFTTCDIHGIMNDTANVSLIAVDLASRILTSDPYISLGEWIKSVSSSDLNALSYMSTSLLLIDVETFHENASNPLHVASQLHAWAYHTLTPIASMLLVCGGGDSSDTKLMGIAVNAVIKSIELEVKRRAKLISFDHSKLCVYDIEQDIALVVHKEEAISDVKRVIDEVKRVKSEDSGDD